MQLALTCSAWPVCCSVLLGRTCPRRELSSSVRRPAVSSSEKGLRASADLSRRSPATYECERSRFP